MDITMKHTMQLHHSVYIYIYIYISSVCSIRDYLGYCVYMTHLFFQLPKGRIYMALISVFILAGCWAVVTVDSTHCPGNGFVFSHLCLVSMLRRFMYMDSDDNDTMIVRPSSWWIDLYWKEAILIWRLLRVRCPQESWWRHQMETFSA